MSTPAFEILRSIEIDAESANVQQIKSFIARVHASRPALVADDREFADALLLKLDRLLCDQLVSVTAPGNVNVLGQSGPIAGAPELPDGGAEIVREAA